MLKGLTAEYLLHRLHPLRPGEIVLVHAAAGGLGSIVVQWARALGATVIGTVSSEDKAQEARQHGCHDVVVTSDYNFSSGVLSATGGRGVDLIIDGLGAAGVQGNLASLARFGHWVSVGQASGALPPISPDALIEKSATFSRPVLFHYTADPQRLAEMAGRLWSMLASGKTPCYDRCALSAGRGRRSAPGTRGARHARLPDPGSLTASADRDPGAHAEAPSSAPFRIRSNVKLTEAQMANECAGNPGTVAPVVDRNRCEGEEQCVQVCPYNVFEVRKSCRRQSARSCRCWAG